MELSDLQFDNLNFNRHSHDGMRLLEKSIKENGLGRSILIDKNGNIIAGNATTEAVGKLGISKVRVVETDGSELIAVKRTDLDIDSMKGRNLALADNAVSALNLDWNFDALQQAVEDFAVNPEEWAVKMPDIRQAWGKAKDHKEPVCDMKKDFRIWKRNEILFISFYQVSDEGVPLSAIKTDENVNTFAVNAVQLVEGILGLRQRKDFCIITAPKRRHTEKNFATKVCEVIAEKLKIPFYADALVCKSKKRIGAVYDLVKEIKESNVIFFDDILTTGSTLRSSINALPDKNIISIIGINNN